MSAWSLRPVMSWSPTSMRPEVGLSKAPSRASKVLLPEPLCPMMEAKQPLGISRLTLATATTRVSPDENCLVRLETFSIILPSLLQRDGLWRLGGPVERYQLAQ